ncbi:ABC transporter substrate-binding protein [Azospirillum argentinense]
MPFDPTTASVSRSPSGIGRRSLLRGAAGACGALALGGLPAPTRAASGPTPETVLRIADYKALDGLALEASGQLPTPFRSQFAEFGSGNLIVEAINAGSIDVGSSSEIPPAFGIAAGVRLSIVAVVKDDVNWQVVLVPPDSPIRSVADLKGKRVGYVRATTTQYYLAKMLGEVGLRFTDIQPVALTPAEGQAAFEQGALDAWAIYGYSVPFAIKKGARVLVTSNGYLSGNYLYLASPDALAEPGKAAAIGEYFLRLRRQSGALGAGPFRGHRRLRRDRPGNPPEEFAPARPRPDHRRRRRLGPERRRHLPSTGRAAQADRHRPGLRPPLQRHPVASAQLTGRRPIATHLKGSPP